MSKCLIILYVILPLLIATAFFTSIGRKLMSAIQILKRLNVIRFLGLQHNHKKTAEVSQKIYATCPKHESTLEKILQIVFPSNFNRTGPIISGCVIVSSNKNNLKKNNTTDLNQIVINTILNFPKIFMSTDIYTVKELNNIFLNNIFAAILLVSAIGSFMELAIPPISVVYSLKRLNEYIIALRKKIKGTGGSKGNGHFPKPPDKTIFRILKYPGNCWLLFQYWVILGKPIAWHLSLIHISEPTRQDTRSRMPSSA